jgi:hypothetical protein
MSSPNEDGLKHALDIRIGAKPAAIVIALIQVRDGEKFDFIVRRQRCARVGMCFVSASWATLYG